MARALSDQLSDPSPKPEQGSTGTLANATGSESAEWEAAPPVLFNTWKHHVPAIRWQIARLAPTGEPGLLALAVQLRVVGSDVMDLYLGPMSPARIGTSVCDVLRAGGLLEPRAFQAWIEAGGGYRVVAIPAEESGWVLRRGNDSLRYVHVHPARGAARTRRVRGNVLKTAIAVLAAVAVHGGAALDTALINHVRRVSLHLPPIRALSDSRDLGAVIELLERTPATPRVR